MSKDLVCFNPTGFTELMEFAKIIAQSGMVPDAYRGKPGDIVAAVMIGHDVRLSPMQALLHIAVIRGKPCLFGDGFLAVVTGHPAFAGIREWSENTNTVKGGGMNPDGVAYCSVKRVLPTGEVQEVVRSFSVDDAKRASLWGNKGPWSQYPERMLQMRARSFACRDCFPDALKGIMPKEEVDDYNDRPAGRVSMRHPAIDAVMPKKVEAPKEVESPKPLSESATSATSATLPGAVGAEYVMCSAPLETTPEPKAKVKDKAPKVKTKPTNKQRCLDAMERFLEVFGVAGKTLLDTAGIKAKTVDGKLEPVKVTNVQVDWLVDAFTALKDGKKKVTDIFPTSDALPPIPPVPSGDIQVDAQQ